MVKRLVYLDNAATTPVRPKVLEAMLPYLGKDAFGNPSSAHRFGRTARAGVEEAKRTIAEALGVEPGQVIFTSGGTEADNLAVIGSALAARARGGPFRVAVAATEHKAVLAAAHAVQHLGGDEVVLPVDASGVVEEAALERALASGVAVVSVMWVNNEVGTIQPVARLAARCCEAEVPYHSDAVQAFGKVPVSLRDVGCTLVTISGHKIGAPKGIGALIVRDRHAVEAIIHGGGQQFGLRPGTENVPGIIGLGRAVELAAREQVEFAATVRALRDELERRLLDVVPDAVINGTRAARGERLDPRDRLRSVAHAPGLGRHRLLVGLGLQHRGSGAVARAQRDGRAARARRGGAAVFVREGQRGRGRGGGGGGAPADCREGESPVGGVAPVMLTRNVERGTRNRAHGRRMAWPAPASDPSLAVPRSTFRVPRWGGGV